MDAKRPGDLIYVLGTTFPELGGSEYFGLKGWVGNGVPRVDAGKARTLYERLHNAMGRGLVASCHDCSDGGLGIALAESAFAGNLGMSVDLGNVPAQDCRRNDTLLFSESQSRFVITIHGEDRASFEELFSGLSIGLIGNVMEEKSLRAIGLDGRPIINVDIEGLKKAWQNPLSSF
jgi:phosphoribosylformylglycinamidine synthase